MALIRSIKISIRRVFRLKSLPMQTSQNHFTAPGSAKTPAIVFDYGGVLMDWDPYYLYRKMIGEDRQAVERFLKEVDFAGWNLENDRGRPVAESTAILSARFPQYRELINAYDLRYLESLGGAHEPVVAILRTLKASGYPLYGLSNWPADKFALVRERYPFFAWFDDMVISGEVKLIKPDPAIFELLLARIGRPAGECLIIDDSRENIRVAAALGFQTILFEAAEQLKSELRRRDIL